MKAFWMFGCVLLCAAACLPAAMPDGRYLYLSMPDGAQREGRSGSGILVFNMDAGFKYVRRIEVPDIVKEGVRGFTGSLATHSVYLSTTNHRMICLDLESEKILWNQTYKLGCDRSSISVDGKKIYAPTGWWYNGKDGGFVVIDAVTGKQVGYLPTGARAHNSIASLDGRYLYLGTQTKLTVYDAKTEKVVRAIEPVGESGVFPFTVRSKNDIAYVCLGRHVGVDVVDLKAGKVLHRVFAGEQKIKHRTHGAGLTPDETELWISDQKGKKLFIFDATQMPPAPKGHVELSQGGHGWVCFTLDGKHALCHTPDVFDAKTKKVAFTLKDEKGKPVSSSKFIEVHFKDGKVVKMGHEFGLGRVHPAGGALVGGDGGADSVKLFDGKTFQGWEGNLDWFKVEDGAVVAGTLERKIPRNEFLCTEKKYGDFELRLDVKLTDGKGNAGIQFRTKRIPNHHEVIGYQADVGGKWWGKLYDESRRRKVLAGPDPAELAKVLKPEGWNQYVIRAEGDRIRLWLNGLKTVDFREPDPKVERDGVIALQIHSGPPSQVRYRNITLVELK